MGSSVHRGQHLVSALVYAEVFFSIKSIPNVVCLTSLVFSNSHQKYLCYMMNFFSERVVRWGNRLPREMVELLYVPVKQTACAAAAPEHGQHEVQFFFRASLFCSHKNGSETGCALPRPWAPTEVECCQRFTPWQKQNKHHCLQKDSCSVEYILC